MFPIILVIFLAGAFQEAVSTAPVPAHVGHQIPADRPVWQSDYLRY